ncbi:LTA synthase family protein [Mobilitalea sibirica]|uniref:LTA synthase family protein n=1 Tax=Mobilitalea sibirica TaxID=1462919 RepID=A0A8J7H1V6_9FIRM|nr:LTA synthase family protein [Mobilitalea sibirica]MBH1940528.1 LTA synthase family protein [Mobilitalea sibirica]
MIKKPFKKNRSAIIADPELSNKKKEIAVSTINKNAVNNKEIEKDVDNKLNEGSDETIAGTSDNLSEEASGARNKIKQVLKRGISFFRIKLKNNFSTPLIFFVGLIIYLELVLHLHFYRGIDSKIIYPFLYAVPIGILFTFLTGIFKRIVNIILMWFLTVITCLIFAVQLIYYSVFKVFFSFQTIGMADDAISEFGGDITTAIRDNIIVFLLILLPLLVLAIFIHRFFHCEKRNIKKQAILLTGMLGAHLVALLALFLFGVGDYTPYDLYHKSKVPDLCGKQLGVVTLTRFDLTKLIFGEDELVLADTSAITWDMLEQEPTVVPTTVPKKISEPKKEVTPVPEQKEPGVTVILTPTPPPTPTPIDTSPNIMNIDFVALAKDEKDETIKTLHQYFSSVTPTNKNEYTGMFKGYNLIMITAEGFSPYAVHQEKTPTLYKLTKEGFIFNNFYTALWQTSTSDGEFVAMTGLIPVGTRSMYHSRNNLMPFALGHQFNRLGIESKAYHNHTYTYYQRNETHPNLGYIFKAKGNGLVLESDVWPGSDLEMINHTVDEYTDEEQFHVYYLTVSGHMNYTFVGNSMSSKNKDFVKDLPYSSDVRAYIACQVELDKALEELIRRLTEAGVADKTVIALSADHYPYGWEKDKLDEIAGHEVDPNFEVYRNHFILWTPGMEESIVVEKPASSLDILPTLSNLFGFEYDSRLLMGRDIFSEAEPLVILNNRSFITDKVMFNSQTGEVIQLTQEELPEDYIKNLNKIIKNKFTVSQMIIKKDYYRSVFPELSLSME